MQASGALSRLRVVVVLPQARVSAMDNVLITWDND